jgi:hypothetical protein
LSPLPARLRSLTPTRLRDDPRLRAPAVGLGLIPPRTMRLGGLRSFRLLAALLLAAAPALGACGGGRRTATGVSRGTATHEGPALGLTEDNADLLWSPDGSPWAPAAFRIAARELSVLHPSYLRLLVDWAALQPNPDRPPALGASVSGCARRVGPCGPYAGLRDELAAIASKQRAAPGGFQVVIDVFGSPAWAARAPSGCERAGTSSFSRPLSAAAIAGYRTLIGSLLALGAQEGVALNWWSPWNEPNNPAFISPQRSSCAADSPPVSPAVYAELAAAMAAELRASGGEHHLLLGELEGNLADSPDRTSVSRFVAALPADVLCLSEVWSIHAYASPAKRSADPVGALETALDARGACGRDARIWVTEAGAGASHPGWPRTAGAAEEEAGCLALAEQLTRWYRDSRVGAVFQYTFREDPAFPVGLVSADLSHLYPSYHLWLQWSRLRAAGEPPPTPAAVCA